MTQQELFQALKSLGMPVAYDSFREPQSPPFVVYKFVNSADFVADNQNLVPVSNFQVELYTRYKDLATEQLVQNKLKELRLPYAKREFFIDNENVFQIIYEIRLIGG